MTASEAAEQVLTFYVGDDQFAAAAADVSEVFRRPRITRVPHGPASLLGVAALRGMPTPVVSLARLMGREDQPSERSRLLLIEAEQPIGLMVDRVGALADLPVDGEAGDGRKGLGRLFMVEDAGLRLLDLEAMLRRGFAGIRRGARVAAPQATGGAVEAGADLISLLGFDLAGQGYGLPLDEVAEILPLPPRLASIAQSEAMVLGVTTVRDRLLPIVSLRGLLGLPRTHQVSDRVIVARIGDAQVGLAVDRLRAIVRTSKDAIDPAPAVLNRGAGEAQVQFICRLPDGGLLGVLSSERLFSDEKVAHILADGRNGGGQMTATSKAVEAEQRFLIFRLGEEEYGLPLAAVDEVAPLPDRLTRVPNAPSFIEGVLNLRGKVTPIIDQRARFGSSAGVGQGRPKVIVTDVEGRQAGFIVDAVSEILSVPESQIEATSELTADAGRLFSRIATLDDGARLILLIEPKEMLDRAERDLLGALDRSAGAASA